VQYDPATRLTRFFRVAHLLPLTGARLNVSSERLALRSVVFALFLPPEPPVEDDVDASNEKASGEVPLQLLDGIPEPIQLGPAEFVAEQTPYPFIGSEAQSLSLTFEASR
jgi:hypothetical protein